MNCLLLCVLLSGAWHEVVAVTMVTEYPNCSKYEFQDNIQNNLFVRDEKLESTLGNIIAALKEMKQQVNDMKMTSKLLVEQFADSNTRMDQQAKMLERNAQIITAYQSLVNKSTPVSKNTFPGETRENGAFISRNPAIQLPYNDTIIFPEIVVNGGGAYNPKTGHFTAKTPGAYFFTTQLCGKKGSYIRYQIVKGSRVYSTTEQFNKLRNGACSSSTAVIQMEEGERVCVRCVSPGSQISNNKHQWNMFTGIPMTQRLVTHLKEEAEYQSSR